MEEKKKLSGSEKFAYGIGAVGKDMMYMFSASYVLYYFQDILGVSAIAMGVILMAARVFDAFNDPIMGVLVAKTKTKWGKFRPWLLIGTITNAIVLAIMFNCPPTLSASGLIAYAAVTYILWGVTYTMMDIPYWSMIPAFTEAGKEREGLSALARSCAGVGSAIVSIVTVMGVSFLGHIANPDGTDYERIGYGRFALVISAIFIVFICITCAVIKEKSSVDMQAASVGEMFSALVKNDQAMTMVISIVCINTALYITSNLGIYFFKYDFSGADLWESHWTLFNTAGGGFQILAMMLLFPLFRKFMNTLKIFYTSFTMAMVGYLILLGITFTGTNNIYVMLVPSFLIMSAIGMLNVVVTIFLANTVDYGEIKNNRRDEAVIFSMQTFVVKLASGIAALIASIVLAVTKINSDSEVIAAVAGSSKLQLRMSMTLGPIVILLVGLLVFKAKFALTDEKMSEITAELESRKNA